MIVRRSIRTIVTLGVVAIVGAGTYAFTASNTVTAKTAGAGSAAISGYDVTGVSYALNSTNPQNIDSVAFTINPAAAATVKASLDGSTWFNCTNSLGSVSCTTSGATVASSSNLTVVATG